MTERAKLRCMMAATISCVFAGGVEAVASRALALADAILDKATYNTEERSEREAEELLASTKLADAKLLLADAASHLREDGCGTCQGHRIAMAENIKLFLDGRPVPLLVGRSQQGGQS